MEIGIKKRASIYSGTSNLPLAQEIADHLAVAGADRVLTVDLHSGQIQGFFDIPVDHLTALPILAEYVEEHHRDNIVVVAPDAGRVRVAEKYSLHLDAPLALMRKRRMPEGKGAAPAEVLDVVGDVAGKRCLVVDDMIDTGGTPISGGNHPLRAGARGGLAAAPPAA